MAKQNRKGIWVQLPSDVKKIIDMVCSMRNKTRKEYCQEIIEASIADDLDSVENISALFTAINPELTKAYTAMVARVNARVAGIPVPVTDDNEEDEENGYDEEIDLPQEVTGRVATG